MRFRYYYLLFLILLNSLAGCGDKRQPGVGTVRLADKNVPDAFNKNASAINLMFRRGVFPNDNERDSIIRNNFHIVNTDTSTLNRYNASSLSCTLYFDLNNDSALYYGRKAYHYAVELHDDLLQARALNLIGVATNLSGRSSAALDTLFRSRAILANLQGLKDSAAWIITYRQIGAVYLFTGDYQAALPYYRAALHIRPGMYMDSLFHSFALIDMASLYLDQSSDYPTYLDSAFFYANQVMLFMKMLCYDCENPFSPEALNTLARTQFLTGDTIGAIRKLHAGLSAFGQNPRHRFAGQFYQSLAEIYHRLGRADSALFFASKSLSIAKGVNSPKLLESSSQLLMESYASKRNLDSAFAFLSVNKAARDSLNSTFKANRIKQLSIDESLRQKEEADRLKAYQARIQRLALLFIAGVFMVSGIVLWRNNRQKHQLNLQLTDQKNRLQSSLEELKSTQAQLVQSEKMASLGELTAGIAHEIQNPLNFVNNFSDLNQELIEELKEELNRGDVKEAASIANNLKENEAKINLHGRRADGIVKSMLQHSRSSSGQKESTDMNMLVDEYVRLAYHGYRARYKDFNVKLDIDLDQNLPLQPVVAQDIGRVMLNLLNNAFQAVEEKARTAGPDYQPTVSIQTKSGITHSQDSLNPKSDIRNPKSIVIAIADNGPGIPDHARDKIFQPFFTTKPTGQGTGLGLSLSYDIVKAHGGSLRFESDASRGTTFIVEIPAGDKA
ncbi:MAG: ATP-binding protein [Chitinophagaceae bacterium]|nr:ATP-binding protein [Chitinophagaceae bacterium]